MSKDTKESLNSDEVKESESAEQSHLERRAAELRKSGLFKSSKPEPEEEVEDKPEVEAQSEEEESETEETEEVSTEEEESTEESEETETGDAEVVLSNIDYENLDKDQANELGRILADQLGDNIGDFMQGAGSKGGKEIGKVRGKLRDAEEKIKQLEEGLDRVSPNVNVFADITDEKDLDKLETDLTQNYDRYNDIAIEGEWETNDLGDEGVIDNGTFYTKKSVLQFLKDARVKIRAIPDRRAQLGKRKLVSKSRDKVAKSLSEKFEWFGDKESPESKSYTELIGDASIASAIHLFPDIESVLMNAFANSVGATPSRKKITMPLRNKPKPLGGGDNGSGGSGRKKSKGLQEAQERLKGGMGNATDYATANKGRFEKFFNKT